MCSRKGRIPSSTRSAVNVDILEKLQNSSETNFALDADFATSIFFDAYTTFESASNSKTGLEISPYLKTHANHNFCIVPRNASGQIAQTVMDQALVRQDK